MKKQKGFTLIELLVVIAIIGIMAALVIVNLNSATKKARDSQRKSDLANVKTALEMYFQDNSFNYPASTGWTPLGNDLGSYFETGNFPTDPTDSGQYVYTYTPTGTTSYTLTALLENDGTTWTVNSAQ